MPGQASQGNGSPPYIIAGSRPILLMAATPRCLHLTLIPYPWKYKYS